MRLRRTRLKGIMCALLTGAMIMASVAPASAATARATTMKLEKTEGTVTLKTLNGSARKISNGMRLYNGNTLETAKYSYAHISLDSTKAVKLDQSSSATLCQSGNQLELLVKSGKLFFNVSKKLDSKESMNVRTSTMVTGVRGTCGVVEYVDVNKSKLYLIEGKVTLGSGNNATTIYGGQTATVVLQPKQETGSSEQPGGEDKPGEPDKPGETDKEMEQKVMVETLTEETIPPVALQEIVANPVLQEKIEQTTELKIEKIEEALEQFEKEEAERIEQEKAEQEEENEKDKENEGEKAEEEEKTDSSSSSSSGTYEPAPPSQPVKKETVLTGAVTSGALKAAFQEYDKIHIKGVKTFSLEENETFIIPGGKELVLWNEQSVPETSTIQVGEGGAQALLCVAINDGSTDRNSLLAGIIEVTAGSRLEDHGSLDCTSLSGGANAMLINNQELRVSGTMSLSSGTTFDNHGYFSCGKLSSAGGAEINNTDRMMLLEGAYTSSGTDKYSDDENAVVVSQSESTAMPDGSLLMSAGSSYYYARSINKTVKGIINLSETGINWQFAKDAEIPAGDTTELTDFKANMGDHALLIKGTLKLLGATSIESSASTASVRLMGGKLILADSSSSSATGTIKNTGTGYAIGWESGTMEWNDTSMQIISNAGKDYIMQGVQPDENGTVSVSDANYCQKPTDYVMQCDVNNKTLKLVNLPASFESSSDNLTVDRLNTALKYYSSVTIGENMSLSMTSGQTVTIPDGRMLHIASKEAGTDNTGYSGSVSMQENSNIMLENNATLKVSGTITGNGTIGNADSVSSGSITVESTGTIRANKFLLKGCDLDNNGVIDGGTIETDGSGTIRNDGLIKIQSYASTDAEVYEYARTDNSVLVCNNNLEKSLPTAVLFATATASGSAVVQYYYAPFVLNERMVERINTINKYGGTEFSNGAAKWDFHYDVWITKDYSVDFAGANINMGTNEIMIGTDNQKAHLTLNNIGTMTGSDELSVIRLFKSAQLTIGGDGTNARIENTASGPAISLEEVGNPDVTEISAAVNLGAGGLTIKGTSQDKIFRGMSGDKVPDYVHIFEGYECSINATDNGTEFKVVAGQ